MPVYKPKKSTSASEAPTLADLREKGARISSVAPGQAGKVEKATSVPKFIASTLLKAIDAPRKFVFEKLLSPAYGKKIESGYELADEIGIGEGLVGKVGGFVIDVVADPTTYITAGTGGAGRAATKEMAFNVLVKDAATKGRITEEVAKLATGKASKEAASTIIESPVVKDIATRIFGEEVAEGGKRWTLSQAARTFTKEESQALAKAGVKTGGIRFAGFSVVPHSVTSKVTAPVAKVAAPKLAKAVSKISPKLIADATLKGHLFTKGMREAADMEAAANDILLNLANRTAKVVKRDDPVQLQAFFDKIWRPGQPELWAGKLSAEAEQHADEWAASWAAMLDEAQAAGVPIDKLATWEGPRVTSEAGRKALFGPESLAGRGRIASVPGYAKHRVHADFDEAQELMAQWLNLKPGEKFFSEDPFKALAQYGMTMNKAIHRTSAMTAFDKAGIRIGTLDKTTNDLMVAEIKAAGFKSKQPIAEARRLVMDANRAGMDVTDPRFTKLSTKTQDLVRAEALALENKLGYKIAKKNVAIDKSTKRLLGNQNQVSEAEKGFNFAMRKVSDALPKAQARLDQLDLNEKAWKRQLAIYRKDLRKAAAQTLAARPDFVFAAEPVSKTAKEALEADVRRAQRELNRIAGERKAILSKFDTSKPDSLGRAVNVALENKQAAEKRVAEQQARLAQKVEEKANLEAGLKASGKEFPGPKVGRGEVPEGYKVVQNSGIGDFDGKAWPVNVAQEIEESTKFMEPIFGQTWAAFTGLFKKWVTIPFPGFHARNAVGGFYNNFVGGVGLEDYVLLDSIRSGRLADDADLSKHGIPMTAGELKQHMYDNRIMSPAEGGPIGRLQDLTNDTGTPLGQKFEKGFGVPGLKQVSEGVEKYGGGAMAYVEEHLRGAAFIKSMKDVPDPYAARMFTMARHGDYDELTSFERNVLKQVLPFYKWMRMNVPYQLQTFIEQPGRVGIITDFWNNVIGDPDTRAEFEAEGGLITPLMESGGAVFLNPANPIAKLMGGGPGKNPVTLSYDLPVFDINQYFTSQGWPSLTGVAAGAHPFIRTAQELIFKKRFYGGGEVADLNADFVAPTGMSAWAARALEHMPGGEMVTFRSPSGELKIRTELASILAAMPMSRVSALADSLVSGRAQGLVSAGLGARLTEVTPGAQEAEAYRRRNILDDAVTELYRQGKGEAFTESGKTTKKKKVTYPVIGR